MLKPDWLSGGGDISELIRAKDWSATPLGPIDLWPQSLRTTVSLCLASNFPINIIWGPEATQIYNRGYKSLCGKAHPRAMGESYRVTWQSAWPAIGEPFEKARLGETTFLENQRMFLFRNGYHEETFFTFSLSPIRNETGDVVGLFHPVTETTTAMLNQRRTRLLRDITSESANSDNVAKAAERIARTLADYTSDIPGALILIEKETGRFETVATSGDVDGFSDPDRWPIPEASKTLQPVFISDVVAEFGEFDCSEYQEPIRRACLLPLIPFGSLRPIGFIAATMSPRLPFNETYMGFLDLLTNAVTAALTNALENERVATERTEFISNIDELNLKRTSQSAAAELLIQSKEAAEAATLAKSAFLANMSHEIRTPLAAILGFTEILKSHDINIRDRDKYLNIISRNGHSLVRIIDDILDLSKIEAGKIMLDKEPICLTELIHDIVAMFSDRAIGKGLSLNFDPTGLPNFKIQSDPVRIRQILINLLGNAIKFTSEGSVSVRADFKSINDSQYQINLRVTDTGIGISLEQGATLFQAFTQADNKTTRLYGGTGLGLALSKKLANAMGGDVSIEQNSASCGTTFLVELVVTEAAEASRASHVTSSSVEPKPTKQLEGWSILVVDDSPDNRALIKILLEREGAVVSEASSGAEGIQKALDSKCDVVLMDIQMPDMDGYQALASLRSKNYRKPVFALTAHTLKEEKNRAQAAGFSGHISKPVNAAAAVETLLAHSRRPN